MSTDSTQESSGNTAKKKPDLREAVMAVSVDGVAMCPDLLALAKELGVDTSDIGTAANQAGVRIKGCSLGCF